MLSMRTAHQHCSLPARRCPPALPPQIAKLLIIPFVCFIESSFLGRTFTREVLSSIVLVVAGVAVVTGACWFESQGGRYNTWAVGPSSELQAGLYCCCLIPAHDLLLAGVSCRSAGSGGSTWAAATQMAACRSCAGTPPPLLCCPAVQDLQLDISFGGMVIAAVSVVSSGLQQIFVRTMQQKHKLSAHELLSNTAPAQVRAAQPAVLPVGLLCSSRFCCALLLAVPGTALSQPIRSGSLPALCQPATALA